MPFFDRFDRMFDESKKRIDELLSAEESSLMIELQDWQDKSFKELEKALDDVIGGKK